MASGLEHMSHKEMLRDVDLGSRQRGGLGEV